MDKFIGSALKAKDLQQSSFAHEAATERLDRVETSMAGLGREIEEIQPRGIADEGAGRLYVKWSENDAHLSWEHGFKNPLGLRASSSHAFSLYGEWSMGTAAGLADVFVRNVRTDHFVLPPNFEFPKGRPESTAPDYWDWSVKEPALADESLPGWIAKLALAGGIAESIGA